MRAEYDVITLLHTSMAYELFIWHVEIMCTFSFFGNVI